MTKFRGQYKLHGFTLIEVLAVVVIIAIAAAVVVPNMLSTGTMSLQAASRMVIADLLYAQNQAIAEPQKAPFRLSFDLDNDSYRLVDASGNVVPAQWRLGSSGSGDYIVDFAADSRFQGVRIVAANFSDNNYIDFDYLGTPNSGGYVDLESAAGKFRVSVTGITGRVSVAEVTEAPPEEAPEVPEAPPESP